MNQQTTQSLEEIFEKGKTNELQKLNEGLHTRFPDLNSEQMIVAKARFIKDNELAFCNEFNQGSRYNDALLEFDNAFFKNQSDFKTNTFCENAEFTKNEILNHWGLGVNRKQLFLDFFEVGLDQIALDLGRKQAWQEFGFGSKSIEVKPLSSAPPKKFKRHIRKKMIFSLEWKPEYLDDLKKLYYELIKKDYIESIDFLKFEMHFTKGKKIIKAINWKADITELVYLMDHLLDFIEEKCYSKNGIRSDFRNHFSLEGNPINKRQAIYDARRRYNSPDLTDDMKKKLKNITQILSRLRVA